MLIDNYKPIEQVSNEPKGMDKQAIQQNLKVDSQRAGDILGAVASDVVPFKRALETGTLFTQFSAEKDLNFDIYGDEAKKIKENFSYEDWGKLNEAESLTEMNVIATQLEAANRDAETVANHTNMAGALALYGTVGLLEPSSWLMYGGIGKIKTMSTIASKIANLSRAGRVSLVASEAALVEGTAEALVQSTGARDYEQVAYTALFASVLGGGGYGIYDILKTSHIAKQDDALRRIADEPMNIKVTPEKAKEYVDIFEQDMLTPIRSTALKVYDNTIGKILNNRFTMSPMMEAWRKGGIISAISNKFDTQMGMSMNGRNGQTILNNSDTAMDVKYDLYKHFGEMERTRGELYAAYVKEAEGLKEKPLKPAEFSSHMYIVREKNALEYNKQKLEQEDKIRVSEEDMKYINDKVNKKLEENKDKIPEDEIADKAQELTDIEISKLARDRMSGFELSGTEIEKAFMQQQNNYFNKFREKLIDTGIDENEAFDSMLYTPRIYNLEYIKNNPLEATGIVAQSVRESLEYQRAFRKAQDDVVDAIERSKDKRGGRKQITKDNEATINEIDKLAEEIDSLDNKIAHNEESYNTWNFNKTKRGMYINSDGNYVSHSRLDELLTYVEGSTAKDKKYGRRRVQARSGDENYQAGGVYETNYASDFTLSGTEAQRIRKAIQDGKKISKTLQDKLDRDLGMLDNNPMWARDAEEDTVFNSFRKIDNKRIQTPAERRRVDEYLIALEKYEIAPSEASYGEVASKLEDLYKFRKTSYIKRKNKLDNTISEKRKEMTNKYKELDNAVRKAHSDFREVKDYPEKSAKEFVKKLTTLKNMSELEFNSLMPTRLNGRTMSINTLTKGMERVMQRNEAQLINAYQYSMSGAIAVKHATGHVGVEDYINSLIEGEKLKGIEDADNYAKELDTYRKEVGKYAQGKRKTKPEAPQKVERAMLDKKDLAIARDLFDLTKGTRQISGDPDALWETAVRRISQYNYLTMGGQFAKFGLSEIGAGIYSTGFRYFRELVPALEDTIRMYKGKELSKNSNDSLRMIEAWEIFQHNSRAEYSDAEYVESMFSSKAIDKGLAKGVEKFFRFSGLEAITVLSKMALPRAFFGRIIDQVSAGKIYQPDLLRWGISPDDMVALSKENFILNEHGKLDDFNFDNWKDPELAKRFQRATTRMGRDTIMRPDGVRIPSWMTNRSGVMSSRDKTAPIFLLTKQFMTFTALSHERLLLRGLNEKSAMAALGTITSAALLGMFTMMQDELGYQLGLQDKRRYDLSTTEGNLKLGAYMATRHSFSGMVGMAAESANAVFNPSYRSGEQALSKFAGGATTSRILSARNIGMELAEGRYGTQNQVMFYRSLLPAGNMIGYGSLLENGILSPLIKKEQ